MAVNSETIEIRLTGTRALDDLERKLVSLEEKAQSLAGSIASIGDEIEGGVGAYNKLGAAARKFGGLANEQTQLANQLQQKGKLSAAGRRQAQRNARDLRETADTYSIEQKAVGSRLSQLRRNRKRLTAANQRNQEAIQGIYDDQLTAAQNINKIQDNSVRNLRAFRRSSRVRATRSLIEARTTDSKRIGSGGQTLSDRLRKEDNKITAETGKILNDIKNLEKNERIARQDAAAAIKSLKTIETRFKGQQALSGTDAKTSTQLQKRIDAIVQERKNIELDLNRELDAIQQARSTLATDLGRQNQKRRSLRSTARGRSVVIRGADALENRAEGLRQLYGATPDQLRVGIGNRRLTIASAAKEARNLARSSNIEAAKDILGLINRRLVALKKEFDLSNQIADADQRRSQAIEKLDKRLTDLRGSGATGTRFQAFEQLVNQIRGMRDTRNMPEFSRLVREANQQAALVPSAPARKTEFDRRRTLSERIDALRLAGDRFETSRSARITDSQKAALSRKLAQASDLASSGDIEGAKRLRLEVERTVAAKERQLRVDKQLTARRERGTAGLVALERQRQKSLTQEGGASLSIEAERRRIAALAGRGAAGSDFERARAAVERLPQLQQAGDFDEFNRTLAEAVTYAGFVQKALDERDKLVKSGNKYEKGIVSINEKILAGKRITLQEASRLNAFYQGASGAPQRLALPPAAPGSPEFAAGPGVNARLGLRGTESVIGGVAQPKIIERLGGARDEDDVLRAIPEKAKGVGAQAGQKFAKAFSDATALGVDDKLLGIFSRFAKSLPSVIGSSSKTAEQELLRLEKALNDVEQKRRQIADLEARGASGEDFDRAKAAVQRLPELLSRNDLIKFNAVLDRANTFIGFSDKNIKAGEKSAKADKAFDTAIGKADQAIQGLDIAIERAQNLRAGLYDDSDLGAFVDKFQQVNVIADDFLKNLEETYKFEDQVAKAKEKGLDSQLDRRLAIEEAQERLVELEKKGIKGPKIDRIKELTGELPTLQGGDFTRAKKEIRSLFRGIGRSGTSSGKKLSNVKFTNVLPIDAPERLRNSLAEAETLQTRLVKLQARGANIGETALNLEKLITEARSDGYEITVKGLKALSDEIQVAKNLKKVETEKLQGSRSDLSSAGRRLVRDVAAAGAQLTSLRDQDIIDETTFDARREALIGVSNRIRQPGSRIDRLRASFDRQQEQISGLAPEKTKNIDSFLNRIRTAGEKITGFVQKGDLPDNVAKNLRSELVSLVKEAKAGARPVSELGDSLKRISSIASGFGKGVDQGALRQRLARILNSGDTISSSLDLLAQKRSGLDPADEARTRVESGLLNLQNALNAARQEGFKLTKNTLDALDGQLNSARELLSNEERITKSKKEQALISKRQGSGRLPSLQRDTLTSGLIDLGRARTAGNVFRGGRSGERAFSDAIAAFNAATSPAPREQLLSPGRSGGLQSLTRRGVPISAEIGAEAGAAGQNVANTLASTLSSGVGKAASAGAKLASAVTAAINKVFDINSPAGFSVDTGNNVVNTLARIISSGAGKITSALQTLFSPVENYKEKITSDLGKVQIGATSDLATKVGAFVARSTTKPSFYRGLVGIAGDSILSSPAVTEATYRRSYEKGGIVPPMYQPVEMRRLMRAENRVPAGVPGSSLEKTIVDTVISKIRATGSLVGPLSGPQFGGGNAASLLNPGILFSSAGRLRARSPQSLPGSISAPIFGASNSLPDLIGDPFTAPPTFRLGAGIASRRDPGVVPAFSAPTFTGRPAGQSLGSTSTFNLGNPVEEAATVLTRTEDEVKNSANGLRTSVRGLFGEIRSGLNFAREFIGQAGAGGGGRPPVPPVGPGGNDPGDLGSRAEAARGNADKLLGLADIADFSKATSKELQIFANILSETRDTVLRTDKAFKGLNKAAIRAEDELVRRDPNSDFLTRRFGQRGGQAVGEGLIGGAFPLLFGQGAGAAAGGGLGGFFGGLAGGTLGFGLSLAGTAIGTQVDLLAQATQDTGNILRDLVGNFDQIKEAGLLASRSQEKFIERLIEGGNKTLAYAIIQDTLNSKLGVEGAAKLRGAADAGDRLNRAIAELGLQMQIFIAGPLTALLNAMATVFERGSLESAIQRELGPDGKASPEAKAAAKERLDAATAAGGGIENTGKILGEALSGKSKGSLFANIGTEELKNIFSDLVSSVPVGPQTEDQKRQQVINDAETRRDLAQTSLDTETKLNEPTEIFNGLQRQLISARQEREDIERQGFELRRDYEKQIEDIRIQVADRVTQIETENRQKELEILVKQGEVRRQQFENAATALRGALAGDPLAESLADAVTTYLGAQLSAQDQIEQRRKQFEIEISNQQLETEKFKLEVGRTLSRLNTDTAEKVAEINRGISRRNEEAALNNFNVEKKIARLRIQATNEDLRVRRDTDIGELAGIGERLNLSDISQSQRKYLEEERAARQARVTAINEVLKEEDRRLTAIDQLPAPPRLNSVSAPATRSVSFAGVNQGIARAKQLREQLQGIEEDLLDNIKTGNLEAFAKRLREIGSSSFSEVNNSLKAAREGAALANGDISLSLKAITDSYDQFFALAASKGVAIEPPLREYIIEIRDAQLAFEKIKPSMEFYTSNLQDLTNQTKQARAAIDEFLLPTKAYDRALAQINARGGLGINPEDEERLLRQAKALDELNAKLKVLNALKDVASGWTDSFIQLNKELLKGGDLLESLQSFAEGFAERTLDVVLEFALRPIEENLFKNLSDFFGIKAPEDPALQPIQQTAENTEKIYKIAKDKFAGQTGVKVVPEAPVSQAPANSIVPGPAATGIGGPLGELLARIRSAEGDYTSVNRGIAGDTRGGIPGLDNMTVAQVMSLQRNQGYNAVGAYQFIPGTLEGAVNRSGIDRNSKFDRATQDNLALELILGGVKRPALSSYLTGKSNDIDAAERDALLEWAGLKSARGGGAYDGIAGNRGSVTIRDLLPLVRQQLAGQSSTTAANSGFLVPGSPLVAEPAPLPPARTFPSLGSPAATPVSIVDAPALMASGLKGPGQPYPIPASQMQPGPPKLGVDPLVEQQQQSPVTPAANQAAESLGNLDESAKKTAESFEQANTKMSDSVSKFQQIVGTGLQAITSVAMGIGGVQMIRKGGTYNTLMGAASIFGSISSITGMFGTGGSLSGLFGGPKFNAATTRLGAGGGSVGGIGTLGPNFGFKARALGGPVYEGMEYLVGEQGPEVIRMGANGTVVPADELYIPGMDDTESDAPPIGRYARRASSSSESSEMQDGETIYTGNYGRAVPYQRSESTREIDRLERITSNPKELPPIKYETTRVNEYDFVTPEQLEASNMRTAKMARNQTIRELADSMKTRKRLGL